jgi:DNA-binding LacI/PurR family transcriptional regulator
LREHGLRVPQDVSVLAVAVAEEISEMYDQPVSYLAAGGPAQGARAVQGLLAVIDGRPVPPGANLVCQFRPRATTGPAPAA